ncbi:MAG: 54S ribosomal protein L22, mitochondrial [Caeruleum heppii]|nr:MAG: 54S ribosomal protein L22, mitochondrial [Caeruleum heppii]KAI9673723.1 MAG: 54S ribosomal protein L22, mitochondrial [Caeruleum heppii]
MSLRLSRQPVLRCTRTSTFTSPLPLPSLFLSLSLHHPSDPPHRTLFGFGRREAEQSPADNPVYAEMLKKKPSSPPPLVRGDLASSSIFESEDAGANRRPAAADLSPGGQIVRDPAAMAAVLDPQPDVRKRWERKMLIRSIGRRGRLSRTQQIKRTEREHLAKSHMFKTSVKKLGPLARQISGKTVEDAIVQMRFSKKKAAKEVKAHLEHARNEAITKRGMALGPAEGTKGAPVPIQTKEGKRKVVKDRTELYVDQAWVGRGTYLREPECRARGRTNILRPPYTSISLLLKEEATRVRLHEEREAKARRRKLWVQLPNRPITAQRQYYSW